MTRLSERRTCRVRRSLGRADSLVADGRVRLRVEAPYDTGIADEDYGSGGRVVEDLDRSHGAITDGRRLGITVTWRKQVDYRPKLQTGWSGRELQFVCVEVEKG